MQHKSQRIITGLSLASGALLALYYQQIAIIAIGSFLAATYDAYYMNYMLNVNIITCSTIAIIIYTMTIYFVKFYYYDSKLTILICFVCQSSDVYQYAAGSFCGNNKIGYVSKNKSYEGYVIGFIMTMITYIPIMYVLNLNLLIIINNTLFNCIINCIIMYFLGILGGLISSLTKRIINIKDYSNLLGSHGGWVDRIDSIALPILFYYAKLNI